MPEARENGGSFRAAIAHILARGGVIHSHLAEDWASRPGPLSMNMPFCIKFVETVFKTEGLAPSQLWGERGTSSAPENREKRGPASNRRHDAGEPRADGKARADCFREKGSVTDPEQIVCLIPGMNVISTQVAPGNVGSSDHLPALYTATFKL